MEMNGHLNGPELAEFVLDSTPAVGAHLQHCDKCLDEVTRLRDVIHGLRSLGDEEGRVLDQSAKGNPRQNCFTGFEDIFQRQPGVGIGDCNGVGGNGAYFSRKRTEPSDRTKCPSGSGSRTTYRGRTNPGNRRP